MSDIVILLIGSVVVVSIAAFASRGLKAALVLSPYLVRRRFAVHRLLTAGWVHADAAHLLFNMFTLYFFAGSVVRVLGPVRFVALYVSAVVVAFVPTTLRHMNRPAYSSLGASGAVAAVVFSAIVLDPKLRVGIPFLPVVVPGFVYGIFYLAYSAWHSYRATDGINHDAHFSGAAYGALATFALEPARVTRTLQRLLS